MTVAILCLLAPFSPFYQHRGDDQQIDCDRRPGGERIAHEIRMGLEPEFDGMITCRNRHAPENIIHPAIIGRLAVDEGIPALVIIYFAEHGKLVGLRRKTIVYFIVQILDEFDRSRSIGNWRR